MSNLNNNANSSQYPLTDTNMFVNLLANSENKIDCFDICEHSYSQKCFEYLSNTFPGRITLNIGDSKSVLPLFKKENPEKVPETEELHPHLLKNGYFNLKK